MAHTLNEVVTYLIRALDYCKAHCVDSHTPPDTEKEEAAKQAYQDAFDDLVEALNKVPAYCTSTLGKLLMYHYTYIAVTGDKAVYNYRDYYEYTLYGDILDTTIPSFFQGLIEDKDIPPWNEFTSRAKNVESSIPPLIARFNEPVNDFAFRCMYAPQDKVPKPGGSDMNNDKYYQLQYIECGAYDLIKAYNIPLYTRDDEVNYTPPEDSDEETPSEDDVEEDSEETPEEP